MKQIIVIKLGWVLVGDITDLGDTLQVDGASVVQKWGTTKGLGELALLGPRPDSVIYPLGVATVQKEAVLFRIDCKESAWK